jgi:hypothetical protein
MDEIIEQNAKAAIPVQRPAAKPKSALRQYLETEEATALGLSHFRLRRHRDGDGVPSISHRRDLLRRLGRLLPHPLEPATLGEFLPFQMDPYISVAAH